MQILTLLALLGLLACGGGTGSGGGGGDNCSSVPAAPTGLAASSTTSSGTNLSWSTVSPPANCSLSNYTVFQNGNSIGTTTSTAFSVSGLSASTTYTLTVAASDAAGMSPHSANVQVTTLGNGAFTAGRTKYVRTDATTEYFAWINSHCVVYHQATKHFFVTDPYSNHVMVMDAASETEITAISVPAAYGIDDTFDHSMLYVGTLIGDVYAIDPSSMTVTKRYIGSQIGPYGFSAMSAVGMADGRLALLGQAGGIPSVDGSTAVAIWSPVDNSMTLYGGTGLVSGTPLPCGGMGNIGGFSRSADRTKIILTSIGDELRRPVLPLLPDGSTPPPGTAFGPLVGTAQGRFGDFAWIGYWTLLIERRALALLQSAGVRSLVAVTPQLRYRSKSPAELAELQIEPHARLASVVLPPDAAPSCPACGRLNIKRPDRLAIDAASIPAHLDIFRGRDLTTVIYATERFVATARELKLSNIQCNEVEVYGLEGNRE